MAYIGKSPQGSGVRSRFQFTQAAGGGTSISGADDNGKTLTFSDGEYVDVYLNGVLLSHGDDYGTGTANTISGLAALASGDLVEIIVYDIFTVAKINSEAIRRRYYKTASGSETSISGADDSGATITFAANAQIDCSINGISLVQGVDFNTNTANTVGGLSALTAGQVVEIVVYEKFVLGDTVSKASGGTFGAAVGFTGAVTASGGLNVGTIKDVTAATTGITIDSSGRIFKPETPAILAQGSDNANRTLTNQEPIPFTTSGTSAAYSKGITIVSNNRITVPVAGLYFFSATVYLAESNTSCRIQIMQNGAYNNPHGGLHQTGDAASRSSTVTQIMNLSANDYLQVTNASGSNRTIYNGTNHTFCSMFLIG